MTRSASMTRRGFLRRTALAAGAAAVFPTIITSTALGAAGRPAASDRLVGGAIGTGSMGSGDLGSLLGFKEVQMVAVCDVDSGHLNSAKRSVDGHYRNSDCKAYSDFRELIGRGDLDICTLALPDHWHAVPVIGCARAGIDMHGQKPLARSIREGRAMADAVHRYGRVWQTGSWQRSEGNFHQACEAVRNGRIGKVVRVEVGLPSGNQRGLQRPCPPPANLDYNRWLGPAPWREHVNLGGGSVHWDWRWVMDYSGGQLTDWAGHHIDIAHWGLGYDNTGPATIEGKGEYPTDGVYDVPFKYQFTCKYETGVEMSVGSGHYHPGGTKWFGQDGRWVHVDRGQLSASDPKILQDKIGPGEVPLYKSDNHMGNFLECVRSRELTITPIETALRSISVGLLGEIAMLTGRKIKWNPKTEEIIGDPGAAALLGRSYREPWTLEG